MNNKLDKATEQLLKDNSENFKKSFGNISF